MYSVAEIEKKITKKIQEKKDILIKKTKNQHTQTHNEQSTRIERHC